MNINKKPFREVLYSMFVSMFIIYKRLSHTQRQSHLVQYVKTEMIPAGVSSSACK